MAGVSLSASGLHKKFGRIQALSGVDLQLSHGEVLAIMGPSGSGKSTLLHCLAGILIPDAGEVWFGEQRLDTLSEKERSRLRRSHFGFVFQFGQLIPELPAIENVALPLLLGGLNRADATEKASAVMDQLGVSQVAKRVIGDMSGGQAQRVALARALVVEPDVIFADEPTGSLDSRTGEQVMQLLIETARERGTSVLLVTHERHIAEYAARIVRVEDGLVRDDVLT